MFLTWMPLSLSKINKTTLKKIKLGNLLLLAACFQTTGFCQIFAFVLFSVWALCKYLFKKHRGVDF